MSHNAMCIARIHIESVSAHSHQSGFSLPELLLSAAIIAVLVRMTLPSLIPSAWKESEQVMSELADAIALARSMALRNGSDVTLCPAQDLAGCGENWQAGIQLRMHERVVHEVHWPDMQGQLTWRSFGSSQALQFDSLGGLLHQNGSFRWCPPAGEAAAVQALIINGAGRVRRRSENLADTTSRPGSTCQ